MYNRKDLCSQFISRLVTNYGYNEQQIMDGVTINDNLIADVAVWKTVQARQNNSVPDICIIAIGKEEHIRINDNEYFKEFNAIAAANLSFFVALNLKEFRIFYINNSTKPFKKIEIGDFPTAEDIKSDSSLQKFVKRVKESSKEHILVKFSRCHNIIRNNDKLSPEAAFDEMSKTLFIKMIFEKSSKDELIFTAKRFLEDEKAYKKVENGEYFQYLFSKIKNKYRDDKLFEENEKFRIKRDTFIKIVTELQDINLGITDDDVKGVVFENFLGKTFRGELGQFFTPRTVVDYMVRVLDIKEGETVCDPCCGSGGFLIKAFEYVQNEIDANLSEVLKQGGICSKSIEKLKEETDKSKEGSRYYKLCHDYFWGTDANQRMARTAKMNMIMHGDGHVGVYHHDGLFNVGGVFNNRFDVVLINPPFGAHLDNDVRITKMDLPSESEIEANSKLFGEAYKEKVVRPLKQAAAYVSKDNVEGRPIADFYELTMSNTETLFIERTLDLLKPGGRAAIILPEGVLTNRNMEAVRKLLLKKAQIINITSIPSDVFVASGANVKPCIIFIRKLLQSNTRKETNVSITKVLDAGILSTGLPSNNEELPKAANEIKEFIYSGSISNAHFTKIISVNNIIDNWNVDSFFHEGINFNPAIPTCKIKDVLSVMDNPVEIEDDKMYKRVKVRLFNKGLELRDEKLGREIGTKKQRMVSTGQFIVSRIDGKSGAFGIIPIYLDGAVVTHDFMVFDIDKTKILPEFLELVMSDDRFLSRFKDASSGSTGRKRLSQDNFLNTEIPLPAIERQHTMLADIMEFRKKQTEILLNMEKSKQNFFSEIFMD